VTDVKVRRRRRRALKEINWWQELRERWVDGPSGALDGLEEPVAGGA